MIAYTEHQPLSSSMGSCLKAFWAVAGRHFASLKEANKHRERESAIAESLSCFTCLCGTSKLCIRVTQTVEFAQKMEVRDGS
jgi:hypothetical protein